MKQVFVGALAGLFAVAVSSSAALAQTPTTDPTAVGDWAVSMNTPQGIVEMAMTLKLAEQGKLSGTAKGEIGEFPITGTIDEKGVVFLFTVQYNGSPLTLTFSAPTPDDTMKGTVDFGGMAAGDFAAKRMKPSSGGF